MFYYPNEFELAKAIKQSDEKAFREFFDQYHRRIYLFAYSLVKNKELAEDVVQEVFIKFWSYKEKIDIEKSLSPLLYTIARRVIMNHWRKQANSITFEQDFIKDVEFFYNNMDDIVQAKELGKILNEGLELLTEQQREIFLLSREEGFSYLEIAHHCNISQHTVKYHVVNALNILRKHFEKHGVSYLFFVFYLSDS